jgi:hypothetical protein
VAVEVSEGPGRLDPNRRKSRYGVAYLRAVCSQAGVPMDETSPDEDIHAVDCRLNFPEMPVPVQVKCSSRHELGGRDPFVDVTAEWAQKWRQQVVPVRLVLVVVPEDCATWLRHDRDGTWHPTAAFWVAVTGDELGRVHLPTRQRLTAETIEEWHAEVLAQFGLSA